MVFRFLDSLSSAHCCTDLPRVRSGAWVVTSQSPRGEEMTGRNSSLDLFLSAAPLPFPSAFPNTSFLLHWCYSLSSLLPFPAPLRKAIIPPYASLRVLGREGGFSGNSVHVTYLEKDSQRVRNWSRVIELISDL